MSELCPSVQHIRQVIDGEMLHRTAAQHNFCSNNYKRAKRFSQHLQTSDNIRPSTDNPVALIALCVPSQNITPAPPRDYPGMRIFEISFRQCLKWKFGDRDA